MDALLDLYAQEAALAGSIISSLVFLFISMASILDYLKRKKFKILMVFTLSASSFAFTGLTAYLTHTPTAIDVLTAPSISHIVGSNDKIFASFSPHGHATEDVVDVIDNAQRSILVAAYYLSSRPITDALINAFQRGVEVRVVLDKTQSNAKYSTYSDLRNHGIPVRINRKYAIMHNKFIIIDDNILQTGSFNYTQAAEMKNAENLLFIEGNRELIKQFTNEWTHLWNESAQ